ncbi:MAG TPA: AI-2E family transporter [Candidatus Saccharimonadales bacterium]|nr:AI-2E family transporter [Candidatus Saccharimonadales bacterium]
MLGFRKKADGDTQTINLSIPNATIVRVMVVVILSLIGLAALRQASHALVLIFTAFFLTLALNAPVHWLAIRLPGDGKNKRAIATAISFFVVVVLLAGFLASIVPPLIRQTTNFFSAAPDLVAQVQDENSTAGRFITRYHLEGQVDKLSGELGDRLGNIGGTAVSSVTKLGTSVFTVLTILVLTFMMLIEGPKWIRFIKDVIPERQHARVDRLTTQMYAVVKGYVNGQVVLAAIAAAMLLPALIILGVSYPVALMVVVFICGLIPLVGHTIGAVIVTTVALFTSVWAAVLILGYYILYQQIENYIIQPRIQANSTNMSPLLVFMAVIIGVNFGGLFGGLVAIPVMGCIRILVLEYLHSRHIIEDKTYKDAITNKKDKENNPYADTFDASD